MCERLCFAVCACDLARGCLYSHVFPPDLCHLASLLLVLLWICLYPTVISFDFVPGINLSRVRAILLLCILRINIKK